MFNYIHRIDGSTVNEVLINNQAFTEVGGGKVQHNPQEFVFRNSSYFKIQLETTLQFFKIRMLYKR